MSAISDCDALNNWDKMDDTGKQDYLRGFISQYLNDAGYDPVNVVFDPNLGSEIMGRYYSATKTIAINPEFFSDGAGESIGTATHEAWHAIQDRTGELYNLDEAMYESIADEAERVQAEALKSKCGLEDVVESSAGEDLTTEGDEGDWESDEEKAPNRKKVIKTKKGVKKHV
jgi:hypothetical protein